MTAETGLLRITGMGWIFTFAAAAYNLVRMRNLQAPTVQPA
jgi:hypothetical protein